MLSDSCPCCQRGVPSEGDEPNVVASLPDDLLDNEDRLSQFSGTWEPLESYTGFNMSMCDGLGIMDGGATKTVGSVTAVQELADDSAVRGEKVEVTASPVEFTFAGGGKDQARCRVWVPVPALDHQPLAIHTLPNEATPTLIGLDMLREFGIVVDYMHDRAYSYKLQRMLDVVKLPSGHLALPLKTLE